jgi:hypothetical protein
VKKFEMTGAEAFWYVLGCISFGAMYLAKVPVKKALSDYGLVQMTRAEEAWYVLGCISFGAMYFLKLPAARALSELPEYARARQAVITGAPRLGGSITLRASRILDVLQHG